MLSSEFERFLGKKIFLIKIVWAFMLANLIALPLILVVINRNPIDWNIAEGFSEGPLPLVFIAASVLLAIISLNVSEFFKNRVISKPWNRDGYLKELETSVGENGQRAYSVEDINYFRSLNDEQLKVFRMFNSLFMAFVIRFALNEAIALFGFVLSVIHQNSAYFAPFGLIGFILMMLSMPK